MRAQWFEGLPGKKMSITTLCILHLPVCLRRCDAVLIRAVLPEYHPKIAWCNDRLSEAYAVAAGIEEVVTIELHCTEDYTGSLCSVQARPIKVVGQSRPPEQSYHIEAHSTLVGPESPSRHVTSRRHGRVIVSMPAFGRSIDLWSRTLGPRRKLSQMTILLRASCLRR